MNAEIKNTILTTIRDASAAHNETNDCTVRAITAATGLTYDQVHAAMKARGRKNRKGSSIATMQDACNDLGFQMRQLNSDEYSAKTILTAQRDRKLKAINHAGRGVILNVRGHVAGMVEGEILDWAEGRRHRIRSVFEVIAKNPAPQQQAAPMKRMGVFMQEELFTSFPLPTVEQAFELGVEAAQDGYSQDCNPWIRDDEAAEQKKAWDRGFLSFYGDQD